MLVLLYFMGVRMGMVVCMRFSTVAVDTAMVVLIKVMQPATPGAMAKLAVACAAMQRSTLVCQGLASRAPHGGAPLGHGARRLRGYGVAHTSNAESMATQGRPCPPPGF
jgi:hypothetical protein